MLFLSCIRLSSTLKYSPSLVQSTHFAGVCCSISYDFRSVNISRPRRLFGILHASFSQHSALASTLRYPPLFVQPTYVLFGFVQTKKGSGLIHHWRGRCLVFVHLKSLYVILGCFLFLYDISTLSGLFRIHRAYIYAFTFILGQVLFYFPLFYKPLFCRVCQLRLSG